MKKVLSLLAVAAMMLSCGGNGQKGTFDNQKGAEVKQAPTTDKPSSSVMYLYQHDGIWFYISAGHKAYFRKFKKDYGEKFIGVGVTVKKMLGEVN